MPADLPPDAEARLLPCPFCGCDDVFVMNTHRRRLYHNEDVYLVSCNGGGCGAEINLVSEDSARAAWNRRLGLAAASEDAANDTARLDWLLSDAGSCCWVSGADGRYAVIGEWPGGSYLGPTADTPRAAIDAARKGGSDGE